MVRVTFLSDCCPFPSRSCHIILRSFPFAGQTHMFKCVCPANGEEYRIMLHEREGNGQQCERNVTRIIFSLFVSHSSLHSRQSNWDIIVVIYCSPQAKLPCTVRWIGREPLRLIPYINKKPLKAIWPDCEALTFELGTFKVKVTDKGPNGNN